MKFSGGYYSCFLSNKTLSKIIIFWGIFICCTLKAGSNYQCVSIHQLMKETKGHKQKTSLH